MVKKPDSLQQNFIDSIKHSLSANLSLVDELAELLGLSTDSVYRRIRGETTFTFDEIIKICNAYHISFDSFCKQENDIVSFTYSHLTNDVSFIIEYLQRILNDMKIIDNAKEKEIIYTAEDIPLFHLFKFPELASFKIFYWMKSVMNVPSFEGKKYDPLLLPKEVSEIGKKIIEIYKRNPSTEIWNDRTISSIIKQIDFYYEAGIFHENEMAVHLCDVLSAALNDIQQQAEKATKADVAGFEGNFALYNSDIELGNNYILVNIPTFRRVYIRYHTFNNMISINNSFCNETELWLKGIMKKSTLISGVSEKQRNLYFMKAQEQVAQLKNKIK
ncbi:MAG TPA: helix-turn-helix transcriptional regulator [Bacteroidales bacterium]|nr:helix-turn-helix transcriptional regulator [Bacteroidales bacterium]HPS15812.1 helix-turn-helix transcriptional regulator [Bacteroidales bacterium]